MFLGKINFSRLSASWIPFRHAANEFLQTLKIFMIMFFWHVMPYSLVDMCQHYTSILKMEVEGSLKSFVTKPHSITFQKTIICIILVTHSHMKCITNQDILLYDLKCLHHVLLSIMKCSINSHDTVTLLKHLCTVLGSILFMFHIVLNYHNYLDMIFTSLS